jgi:HSP90 family molecular chaperone
MSKKTKKSRYKSKYSPNKYVTAAQYIIELLCEKKAKFLNKQLPMKFWAKKEWAKYFQKNLRQVHKLLEFYNEEAIIAALNSMEADRRYSIFTEEMKRLIEKEQQKIDVLKEIETTPAGPSTVGYVPGPKFSNDTVSKKLAELDNL